MESFSLRKYWRSSAVKVAETSSHATTQTISTMSLDSSDDEEGPYYDMEFAIPDPDDNDSENGLENEENAEKNEQEIEENGEEVELTIESSEEHNVKVPTDENCKLPGSLQKSATKFRVLLLKLKKSKERKEIAEQAEKDEGIDTQQIPTWKMQEKQGKQSSSSKHFTVKLKVDDAKTPLVSFFTRDSSSKQSNFKGEEDSSEPNVDSGEKKLSKEVVQKYLNMVKPTYIRVSKRYAEKLHLNFLSGVSKNGNVVPTTLNVGEGVTSCVKSNLKHGNSNFQAGLKVVKKHLGKSRSASETVTHPKPGKMALDRRDDSLLEVQDGIQGAILHCKRSFNGSDDVEASSVLSRSASDPSYEKSVITGTVSSASASS